MGGSTGAKQLDVSSAEVASQLLETLRAGTTTTQLHDLLRWSTDEVDALVELLVSQALLEAEADRAPGPQRRVVLFGLGALGLAALDACLEPDIELTAIADDATVAHDDAGSFYTAADVGRERLAIARARLPAASHERLTATQWAADTPALLHAIGRADVVLLCLQRPTPMLERLNRAAVQAGVPCVLVEAERDGVSISVLRPAETQPASAGCLECRTRQRLRRDALSRQLRITPPNRPPQWRHRPPPGLISAAVTLAMSAVRAPASEMRWEARETFLSASSGRATVERIVREPLCRHCQRSKPFERDAAFEDAAQRWRAAVECDAPPLPLSVLGDRLRRLEGARVGLLAQTRDHSADYQRALRGFLDRRGIAPLPALERVRCGVAFVPGRERVLIGESFDFEGNAANATTLAQVEGLERLCSLDSLSPARTFTASYESLGESAIDPQTLELYSEEQYADVSFPYRPFDASQPIPWVVGTRLSDHTPVAVPFDFLVGGTGSICQATSNGAAAHTNLRLAILSGVVEALERDAFVVHWLNQLSRPVLDTTGVADPWGLQAAMETAGFEIRYVDITTDIGLPTVLQVVRDRHDADFFIANSASGASPEHALGKLMRELVQVSSGYIHDPARMRGSATAADTPDAVLDLKDHLHYYQRAEHNEHASFLLASDACAPIDTLAWSGRSFNDPQTLEYVLGLIRRSGKDVFVVDCTPPLLAEVGLRVVKAVIPGIAPLYSGRARRRLGGRRICEAPRLMGLRSQDTSLAELNPWPHPGA